MMKYLNYRVLRKKEINMKESGLILQGAIETKLQSNVTTHTHPRGRTAAGGSRGEAAWCGSVERTAQACQFKRSGALPENPSRSRYRAARWVAYPAGGAVSHLAPLPRSSNSGAAAETLPAAIPRARAWTTVRGIAGATPRDGRGGVSSPPLGHRQHATRGQSDVTTATLKCPHARIFGSCPSRAHRRGGRPRRVAVLVRPSERASVRP